MRWKEKDQGCKSRNTDGETPTNSLEKEERNGVE